jgi:hypothetical protein
MVINNSSRLCLSRTRHQEYISIAPETVEKTVDINNRVSIDTRQEHTPCPKIVRYTNAILHKKNSLNLVHTK